MANKLRIISTTSQNPTILSQFVTVDLFQTPTIVEAALSLITDEEIGGVLITSEARTLGHLLPKSIEPKTPLHVIAFNGMSKSGLETLALTRPSCMNLHTNDLIHSQTFVCFGKEGERSVAVSAVDEWEKGAVLRLFISEGSAVLVRDEIDESFFDDFSAATSCAGSNYCALNVWTNDELDKAQQFCEENHLYCGAYNFGKNQVHLYGCIFEELQLTVEEFVVPDDFPSLQYRRYIDMDRMKALVRYCPTAGRYFLDYAVADASTRLQLCKKVARAIAVKSLQEMLTPHPSQSKNETLHMYFKEALTLNLVTRAEACWATCEAARMLGWQQCPTISEELKSYSKRSCGPSGNRASHNC
jgi:hypothetical protein